MIPKNRVLHLFASAVVLLWCACGGSPGITGGDAVEGPDAVEDATAVAGDPAVDADEEAVPTPAGFDLERTIAKIWWNQDDIADELDLSREQRRRMDDHLRAYLERWPEMQRRSRRGARQVYQAVRLGDLEAAHRLAAEYRDAVAYAEGGQLELKVAVVEELTPEQRQVLEDRFGHLVRRRWVVAQRIGAARPR